LADDAGAILLLLAAYMPIQIKFARQYKSTIHVKRNLTLHIDIAGATGINASLHASAGADVQTKLAGTSASASHQ
jgi:hypothetical protein